MTSNRTLRGLGLAALGVVGALVAGVPERAAALTMFNLEVTCPIDGKTFTTQAVGIYRQTGMRLDTRPWGSLLAPMPLPVCPDNGFVVYKSDFTADEITALRTIVLGDEYQRARREHTDHYMVAYTLQRLGGAEPFEM